MKLINKNIQYFKNRNEWRKWLKKNYKKETEVWLRYFYKKTGKTRIEYGVAVEEALCFGWIDGVVNKIDEESFMQRFTSRREKSNFSQLNRERFKMLVKDNQVISEIEKKYKNILNEEFIFPEDILEKIKKDKEVWKNFNNFSPGYKRIRIAYIDIVRKNPEEFSKRLNNFIQKTKENQRIKGLNGTDKYY